MSLPNQTTTTVLIVGAGPAGLAAALSLLHHGFDDFIIVDALPQGKNISRAVLIHAATLDAFDTIGCGDDIVSQGLKCTSFNVGTRSTKLISPDLESLASHTRHPYILVLTQNVTEQILEKKLASFGVVVRRPLKVVGLSANRENAQLSDVTFEDGRIISAKYVIGADGARSAIRTMAGIGFSDPTITDPEGEDNNLAQMVLADITLDTANANDLSLSMTLSRDSLFLFFPLPYSFNESLTADKHGSISERIYRIGCGVPLEEGEIPHSPPKEYLQRLVDRFGPHRLASDPGANSKPKPKPLHIKEVISSTRFRNRASIADVAFTRVGGAVLLIGDAAHIHSPAGGQGMNLGLRDAIFLGEALTRHVRASAIQKMPLSPSDPSEADAFLDAFAAVRRTGALGVIRFTKQILSVAGMKYLGRVGWWCPIDSITVRTWVLWAFGCVPYFQKMLAWELSGLGRV